MRWDRRAELTFSWIDGKSSRLSTFLKPAKSREFSHQNQLLLTTPLVLSGEYW